jgi:transposase
MPFVCVQPMLTSWARRTEDLTFDKTDEKDAVLTAQLRCYVPEPAGEVWGRLRHLGARRGNLVAETVGQVQQMPDLPGCVWPAALDAARQPFGVPDLVRGDECHPGPGRRGPGPDAPAGPGAAGVGGAPRDYPPGRAEAVPADRAALSDPAGVRVHRRGALERAQLLISDWRESHRQLADTEARMVAVAMSWG